MQISVESKSLKAAVDVAKGYVQTGDEKSVYRDIKLTVNRDGGYLIGQCPAGAGIGVRVPIAGIASTEDAAVLLPTDKVTRILDSVGDESLTLTLNSSKLRIQAARSRWEVATLPPDGFMDADYDLPKYDFVASSLDLTLIGDRAAKVTRDDEVKGWSLQCISLAVADGEMVATVSDGFKSIVTRTDARWAGGAAFKPVLVPAKSFGRIKSTFGTNDRALMVSVRANDLVVASDDGITAIYRLVHGKFPDPSKFVIDTMVYSDPIGYSDFVRAINQAAAVIESDSPSDKAEFNPSTTIRIDLQADRFLIESLATERGSAVVDFPAKWTHDPATLYLRPFHLSRVIKALDGLPFVLGCSPVSNLAAITAQGFSGLVATCEPPMTDGKVA